MDNISTLMNNDVRNVLNDVNMLLSSETSIMETELQSRHQYMKTGDPVFLSEGCSDIVDKIEESADVFSNTTSEFQKTISKEISAISSGICNTAKKNAQFVDKLDDFNFVVSGYKFRTLTTKRINLSEIESVLKDYNKMISELQKITLDESKLSEFEDKSREYLEESNLSKIRANMLGVHDPIYEYDFIDEVRRYYRGSIACVDINVTKKYIKGIMSTQQKLIKDKETTIEEISRVMKMFSTIVHYIVDTLNDLNKGLSCDISTMTLKSNGSVSPSKLLSVSKNNTYAVKTCITILRLTYSKVVTLQSMAQIILSERLYAIKDQMCQNLDIMNNFKLYVNQHRQGNTSKENTTVLSKYIEESSLGEIISPVQPVLDYTELAMENSIITHRGYATYLENRYVQESLFIQTCLENMNVDKSYFVMEASEVSLKDRLIEFLNRLISLFRKKMIEYNKKYAEDIKSLYNNGTLTDKAKSYTDELEILPYWNVTNVSQDKNLIRTAMSKGATNKDRDNLSYMSSMVSIRTIEEWDDKKGQLRGYLLNYFRCHEKDAEQVKKITVSGPTIASKLKTMIDYITGYGNIVSGLEELKNVAETNMTSLTKMQESFRFLELEQCPVEFSDIALLKGFSILLEAETNDKKTGEAVGVDGEKTSPTSVESTRDNKSDNTNNNGDTNKSSTVSNRYANIYERFFELAITAYMTACEERYISYINILRNLNGGNFSSKGENDNKKKNIVTDSVLYTDSYFNKPLELKGTSLYK